MWDAASLKQMTTLYKGSSGMDYRDGSALNLIGYSRDGASILVTAGKSAMLLNAATGAEIQTVTQQRDINSIALSPDGKSRDSDCASSSMRKLS